MKMFFFLILLLLLLLFSKTFFKLCLKSLQLLWDNLVQMTSVKVVVYDLDVVSMGGI